MAHEREGARITMPYFLAAPWIVHETDATAKILEKNARMLARYLPIEILPLPPGLAGRYERRVIWHENASGDPALMWLIAMLRSASAQEACAAARAGRKADRKAARRKGTKTPHEETGRRLSPTARFTPGFRFDYAFFVRRAPQPKSMAAMKAAATMQARRQQEAMSMNFHCGIRYQPS